MGQVGEAALARGRHDEDDAMALGRQHRHGPGGQQSFVIGMGVEEDRGTCHAAMIPRAESPSPRRLPGRGSRSLPEPFKNPWPGGGGPV